MKINDSHDEPLYILQRSENWSRFGGVNERKEKGDVKKLIISIYTNYAPSLFFIDRSTISIEFSL